MTAPTPAGPVAGRRRWSTDRIAIAAIAVVMFPAAVQATFDPRGFFDDFPLGRRWVSHGLDMYDEHLVRDVGGLFLGMIVITVWTAGRNAPTRGVALGWLVQGTLHLVHHSRHLDGWATGDAVGLIGSLVMVPTLAVVALVAGPRKDSRALGPARPPDGLVDGSARR